MLVLFARFIIMPRTPHRGAANHKVTDVGLLSKTASNTLLRQKTQTLYTNRLLAAPLLLSFTQPDEIGEVEVECLVLALRLWFAKRIKRNAE